MLLVEQGVLKDLVLQVALELQMREMVELEVQLQMELVQMVDQEAAADLFTVVTQQSTAQTA